ncbi:MAG: hydroxymethylglutaryl-CoA lyase [Betaproteobacteria bacterium]|nr:hydroxymethylglutaryl-CoA lyase [Betaproteobacteria bacterium]
MTCGSTDWPGSVLITEVGPRDGLQNEQTVVPAAIKIELIRRLAAAGCASIEATSFVSPKWVPQLADAAEVMRGLPRRAGLRYTALTPNLKGFEAALAAGVDEVAVFVAASESFSQKNINCSIAESLDRAEPLIAAAQVAGVPVRGYLSCVIACPYEGAIAPEKIRPIAEMLLAMGCYEISLGDTIGAGTAGTVQALLEVLLPGISADRLAGHFHDTYGQALANVLAALRLGIRHFDSSVGGLGGCPYARGATGNLATEDLVYLLNGLKIETGIDLDRLAAAGQFIADFLGRPSHSRVARALAAKQEVA